MSATSGRPPATRGIWRPGDDPGQRQFATLFDEAPLKLEGSDSIGPVTMAYETWGLPSPTGDNAVLVEHALTGDSHAAGPAGAGHFTSGWWDPLIGPGAAIDTDRWWVICPNTLGGCQGTTGPISPSPDGSSWGSRFPAITIKDQVSAEAELADALGIERWAAVIGGSMGGMRALEWAVTYPERVERLIVLACGTAASAEQIALCAVQAHAIRLDPQFKGGDYYDAELSEGPRSGLGLARRIGQISYRSELELAARFGRDPQANEDPLSGGRYAVESYLDHHADKLSRRFDANSYLVLSRAMNYHDVGRGRGGAERAMSTVSARSTVAAIDSDRLYPPRLQYEMVELLPDRPQVSLIRSPYGHDGFLIESEQVGNIIVSGLTH
jgi:homoserine O-acetyltransferase/O-succinyltransferase